MATVTTEIEAAVLPTEVNEVVTYMSRLRSGGLTPSDVLTRGIDFAEALVRDSYPQAAQLWKMQLASFLWEAAAIKVGVHAGQRKSEKEKKSA